MELSFYFSDCAWLEVAHWSVRAYGYLEAGPLRGQSVSSQGVTVGPFCLPLLKSVGLKAACTTGSDSEWRDRRGWVLLTLWGPPASPASLLQWEKNN